jgi:hypothetical protein
MDLLSQLRTGQLHGIERLDLSCDLTEFPREIFTLADSLEVLNLSGNALTSLPDDLPQLQRLRVLFCSNNAFTELPAVLGQCAQLEMVGFKSNRIERVSAAALPAQLRWLILTDNQLTALPAEIGHCGRLQKLMLAGNQLRSLPAELAQCRQLELLRISANPLELLPDWLLEMPRLAWLAYENQPNFTPSNAAVAVTVAWAELTLQQQLGEGASGVIHRALLGGAAVAVKLFKGAVTSDGWPAAELAASLSAGLHPHLIPITGPLTGHPDGTAGLVMHCIAPSFTTLAGPPSLASCSRDVYAPGTRFELATLLRIARSAAAAAAHLHANGLLHGDLYGHNLQCDEAGHCVLGDMGAASFLPNDPAPALALQRLDARAFGCLLEELLAHGPQDAAGADIAVLTELAALRDACLQPQVAARPLLAQISQQLAELAELAEPDSALRILDALSARLAA